MRVRVCRRTAVRDGSRGGGPRQLSIPQAREGEPCCYGPQALATLHYFLPADSFDVLHIQLRAEKVELENTLEMEQVRRAGIANRAAQWFEAMERIRLLTCAIDTGATRQQAATAALTASGNTAAASGISAGRRIFTILALSYRSSIRSCFTSRYSTPSS